MNGDKSTAAVNAYASRIGTLILKSRKERGLTQSSFAEQIGVTIPTLRRVENGDPSVSLQTFLAGLTALDITDSLFAHTPKNQPLLPAIKPRDKRSFARTLVSRGLNSRDAENAAWILSLSGQQRVELLKKHEREQKLCGIALQ